jgi:hypothetical protein
MLLKGDIANQAGTITVEPSLPQGVPADKEKWPQTRNLLSKGRRSRRKSGARLFALAANAGLI